MPELKLTEKELRLHLDYRQKAKLLLAENPNFFGTVAGSKVKPVFPIKYNNSFEELGCIGYQPAMEELTATIKINRASGYGGNACSKGSMEYVRFFLDYGTGGWQDMGMTAVNVHDLPDTKDCNGLLEKPVSYVVRLKIDPKNLLCSKANLPKLRAVLSWNIALAENVPSPMLSWGDLKETYIQIAPLVLLHPVFPLDKIGPLLKKAILNPEISLASLAKSSTGGTDQLNLAKQSVIAPAAELPELLETYNQAKVKVEPERIGVKMLHEAVYAKDPVLLKKTQDIFVNAKLDWAAILKKFLSLKGNVSYEELYCAGIDYHNEAFVATLRVKKASGYNGDLCKAGSREYVGFWIQADTDCTWQYVGNAYVSVYDVPLPGDGLSYSVVLPFDFSKYRKPCGTPVVLKIRAVLSWNVPPSATSPDVVPYWGNIIDSYVQVAPGKGWDGKAPVLITAGGVSVDNIHDVTGLTVSGAKLEFNQFPVSEGSPFAGRIVVQGLSNPLAGMKYRVMVRNLNTAQVYYLNNTLQLLGYDTVNNQIIHPVLSPDASNYYVYQSYLNNMDSVVARFDPGTNDLLEIILEHEDGTSVSQRIQMDNQLPQISLKTENGGCGGYAKGDVIKGTFSVNDAYLSGYVLSCSLDATGTVTGSGNVPLPLPPATNFAFNTAGSASPCGSISLSATEKTVHDSVAAGYTVYASEVVCLK